MLIVWLAARLSRITAASTTRATPGLARGDRGEELQLLAIERAPPLDRDGAEQREAEIAARPPRRGLVDAGGLEGGALEAAERAAQLLVGASVDAAAHGAQERVQREGDRAVRRLARLVVPAQQLDVDVLVEGAGQAVARARNDAPAPAAAVGVA